jgi:hypothetical protein
MSIAKASRRDTSGGIGRDDTDSPFVVWGYPLSV